MITRFNNCIYKINHPAFRGGLIVLLLAFVLGSCRKNVEKERITSYYGRSYTEIFEAFWNGMNSNYLFWDIEKVNWDDMYKTYKPRFEYLDNDKSSAGNAQKAAQYLVDMTKDLSDSHLSLTFNGMTNFVVGGYALENQQTFMPASVRHQFRGDRIAIPRNTFDVVIPKYYLNKAEFGTDGGSFAINLGVIPRNNKNILYLEFSNFELGDLYSGANSTSRPVKPVLDDFFRYTKDPSIDGLIIDLRANTGGSVPDMDFLLGRLVTSPVQVNNTRTRNGDNRLDYGPWIKGYIHPQPGSVDFTKKPIVVLVDGNSVSMSEMTSMAIKAIFPKAKLVGEQTWGGTGQIPSTDQKYLGGRFTAANFVQVYCAGVELRDVNMICYENKGIMPDVPIAYDTTAIKSNIDVMLDKGLEVVTNQ
ncbi:hypothetical protein A4D02_29215 [Niastella koreensis]|uniref:Peptidase S41 n=2 Tax=Niastella koreensis TaxID=354356 RepID=G8TR98_NIAKG|nr:S41 family peptidase [Niastella koreensis]AEW00020.1 peptidase S41 [Niastella koreensis GR20-10]OQP49669.1 hypothetical protein A4D02_29215 [Niastella koreensis]